MSNAVRLPFLSALAGSVLVFLVACTPVAGPSPLGEATASPTEPAGSSVQPSVSHAETSSAPVPHTPDLPAAPEVELDAQGHVVKPFGDVGELLDSSGAVAFAIIVHGVEVMDNCPGSMAVPPMNGSYVVMDVEVTMPSGPDVALILIGPSRWSIDGVDHAAGMELETDSAWLCYDTSERLPYTIAPGEHVRGKLVLDSPVASGRVAYVLTGSAGWSWEFESSGD